MGNTSAKSPSRGISAISGMSSDTNESSESNMFLVDLIVSLQLVEDFDDQDRSSANMEDVGSNGENLFIVLSSFFDVVVVVVVVVVTVVGVVDVVVVVGVGVVVGFLDFPFFFFLLSFFLFFDDLRSFPG